VGRVGLVNVRRDIAEDLGHVSIFTDVFAPGVSNYHAGVQGIMDGTGCCHVHAGWLNCGLFHVANSWFSQLRKIQCPEPYYIMNHLLVQAIDLREVCDIFVRQKRLGGLEELDNNIVENNIRNHILMVQAWLHQASTDELGDGGIVGGFGSRLNFFSRSNFG
jgi:hypothetical protein